MGSFNNSRHITSRPTSIYDKPLGNHIDLLILCDVVQNKRENPHTYANMIDCLKSPINHEIIKGLDNIGVHLVKSEFTPMNRMIKIHGDTFRNSISIEEFSEQIIHSIKKECGENQAVVFGDFLKNIEIYKNPQFSITGNISGNNVIVIECSYDIVDKNHQSISPPKNMVKMFISNENYEKSKLY
jgi:hypothetical protein